MQRAIRFVNDNLDSKLRWDEIATAVGLDPFTFGRGFKLTTGMTPHQYIIRCRLRRAIRLLARDELTLTYPLTIVRGGRGPTVYTNPSRFLTELDADLYETAAIEPDLDLGWSSPPA